MPEKNVPKRKKKNTVFIKPNSHIADILKVLSVSEELCSYSIKLFGEGGNTNKYSKYSREKNLMLNDVTYKNNDGCVVFEGIAFTERGKGNLKTIRISQNALSLFDAVNGGHYYLQNYYKNNASGNEKIIRRKINLCNWCIFCLRSQIEFNPLLNPELYNLGYNKGKVNQALGGIDKGPQKLNRTVFYPSREIRRMDDRAKKIARGGRAIGVLVKKDSIDLCYSIPKKRMMWQVKNETDYSFYLKNDFGPHNFNIVSPMEEKPRALCMIENYNSFEQVVFNPSIRCEANSEDEYRKNKTVFFKDLFSDVYVFPKNENGIKQFQLYNIEDHEKKIYKYFNISDKNIKDRIQSGYDCDAYDLKNKRAKLFFFTGCVTKLHKCASVDKYYVSEYYGMQSKLDIYCFPWQRKYIEKVFEGVAGYNIYEIEYEELLQYVNSNKEMML